MALENPKSWTVRTEHSTPSQGAPVQIVKDTYSDLNLTVVRATRANTDAALVESWLGTFDAEDFGASEGSSWGRIRSAVVMALHVGTGWHQNVREFLVPADVAPAAMTDKVWQGPR